jgi:hypothetical protein
MALSPNLRRKLAHGSNAMLMTVLVVVLVGMLVGLADRHRFRVDLSADETAALTKDTLQKIALIEDGGRQVRITAFTHQQGKTGSYFKNRALKDFLEELGYHSPQIEWSLVDFDRERLTAENLGVKEYGRLLIQVVDEAKPMAKWPRVDVRARDLFRNAGKGKDRQIEFLGEAVFNRAIAQLLSDKRQKIYSLVSHGELSVDRQEPSGLSRLAVLLEQENYALESLNLYSDRDGTQAPRIPADADAVLIASPKRPLSDVEEAALLDFVAQGGPVMLLMDPDASIPGLMTRLDIQLMDGVVMDEKLIFPFNDRPVPRYRTHAITTPLEEGNLLTVLAHIAPLRPPGDPPTWLKWTSILETSRTGWIERGGETRGGVATYDPEIDFLGPAQDRPMAPMMAMAVELLPNAKGLVNVGADVARLVVVGDADFATNQLLQDGPGNPAFLVNAFRWMLRDDARLSVMGQATTVRRLALTSEDHRRLRWLVLGLMPFLSVLAGAIVWSSRRGR